MFDNYASNSFFSDKINSIYFYKAEFSNPEFYSLLLFFDYLSLKLKFIYGFYKLII